MARKNWAAWLAILTLLVISMAPVSAANTAANPGFAFWPGQKTPETAKVWTISFNEALSARTVNSNSVYVTDSKQAKVATRVSLSPDGRSVIVSPSRVYAGGDYNLYIVAGIESVNGQKLEETIIMPFEVVVPTYNTPYVELVVTVTDDLKKPLDLGGRLTVEPNNEGKSPGVLTGGGAYFGVDDKTGKHYFRLYFDGDYLVKYFDVVNGAHFTQTLKVNGIKMPAAKETNKENKSTKSANFVVSSKEGFDAGKAGAIGGRTTYPGYDPLLIQSLPRAGVNVEVYTTTMHWTSKTDFNGEFRFYLPAAKNYTLVVHGNGTGFRSHTFERLTVSGGQMTAPKEPVNVEDPI